MGAGRLRAVTVCRASADNRTGHVLQKIKTSAEFHTMPCRPDTKEVRSLGDGRMRTLEVTAEQTTREPSDVEK